MTSRAGGGLVFALVDDHVHAARLMKRALHSVADQVQLVWLGNAPRASRSLPKLFMGANKAVPNAVIVDLKTKSSASAHFIRAHRDAAREAGVSIIGLASPDAPEQRIAMLQAGADAVYERHHDFLAYRAEMAVLFQDWVRETETWLIRA